MWKGPVQAIATRSGDPEMNACHTTNAKQAKNGLLLLINRIFQSATGSITMDVEMVTN